MADYDTLMAFAGTYPDVSAAEGDYQAVKDLYYTMGVMDTFDAAVVGKKANGKVKIYKKHEQPTRHGGWTGAGWGLATGLTVALFPAAAIGVAGWTAAAGAGVGALAGHAAGGMSRSDLKDMGKTLDEGEAALIVVAATDMSARVDDAIAHAANLTKKQLDVDEKDLDADLDDAKAAADSS